MISQRGSTTVKKSTTETKSAIPTAKPIAKPLSRATVIPVLKEAAQKILTAKSSTSRSADTVKKEIDEAQSVPDLIKITAESVMPLVSSATSTDQAARKFKDAFKSAIQLLKLIDTNEATSKPQQETLQQTVDQASGELKAAQARITEFETIVQTTQIQLSASQNEAKKLEQQLATAKTKQIADEKELQKLRKELEESQHTKETNAHTIATNSRQLEDLRQQIATAQKEQKDLTSRLLQASDEKSAQVAKIEQLNAKLETSAETLAAKTELWETRFHTQNEKLQQLTEQLNAARLELSRQSIPSTPMRYGAGGIPSVPQSRFFDRRASVPATPTYHQPIASFDAKQSPAQLPLDRRSSASLSATEMFNASRPLQSSAVKPAVTPSATPGATKDKVDSVRIKFENYFPTQFNTLMNEIQKVINQNSKNSALTTLANAFRFEFIKLYTDMKQTTFTTTEAIIKKLVSDNVMYNVLLTTEIDCRTEDRAEKLSKAIGGQKTIYTMVFQAYHYGIIEGTAAHLEYFAKQRSACDQAAAPQTAEHKAAEPSTR